MFKPAPSVYVPVEPEGDGIALPSLLSIVVHCSIIAFIIYWHQIPKIDVPLSIETSIVTPEELAALQSDVIANREAVASSGTQVNTTTNATSDDVSDPTDLINDQTSQQIDTGVSRPVSVFLRSDDDPDEYLASQVVVDPKIKDNITKKQEASDSARKVFNETQKERAIQEHIAFEQSLEEAYLEEQRELDKLHSIEAKPASVAKPNRSTKTAPSSLNSNNSTSTPEKSSGSQAKARVSDEYQPIGGRSNQSSSGPSADQLSAAIVNHVKPYWHTPNNRPNVVVSALIKVDSNGNVLSVTINNSDTALSNSLKSAIYNASPLTPVANTKYRSVKLEFITR